MRHVLTRGSVLVLSLLIIHTVMCNIENLAAVIMSGTKVGWIIVLVSVILMVWLKQRSLVYQEEDQFSLWLKENRLEEIEESLVHSGLLLVILY